MARITWFISACISIGLALSALAFDVRDIATRIADAWPAYHPSPGESVQLDAIARLESDRQPGIMARFVEFGRRALLHPDYHGDHFDPGRMAT